MWGFSSLVFAQCDSIQACFGCTFCNWTLTIMYTFLCWINWIVMNWILHERKWPSLWFTLLIHVFFIMYNHHHWFLNFFFTLLNSFFCFFYPFSEKYSSLLLSSSSFKDQDYTNYRGLLHFFQFWISINVFYIKSNVNYKVWNIVENVMFCRDQKFRKKKFEVLFEIRKSEILNLQK